MKTPNKKKLFEVKLDELRANKEKVYALMQQQASDPETIAYYEQQAKELGNIDIEIMDLEEVDGTSYLLKNPNNAKFLDESIKEIEQGETVRYKLSDLKKPEEINCAVSAGLNASREDWEEASKVMNQNGDDILLIDDNFSDDDLNEWTWEEKI